MSAVAEVYDAWSTFQWSRLDAFPCELHIHLQTLLEALPPRARVLDVGAGPARYAIELARQGHRVTVGDVSETMRRMAGEKTAEAGFEIGEPKEGGGGIDAILDLDARDLSHFDDGSFDAVVAFGPFYHLDEEGRRRAAGEAARVLGPGGQIFASLKPKSFWLSLALHSYVTAPSPSEEHLEHLEAFLDTGRLEKLKSPQLKDTHFVALDDIRPLFEATGFEERQLLASSGVAAVWSRLETWRSFRDREPEQRRRLLELVRRTASDPHILGMSDQVLFHGVRDEPPT